MIIVTGGAGFIGSGLIWHLNKQDRQDILVVDNLGKGKKWKNLVKLSFLDYVHKNEFLQKLQKNSFSEIEAIFHLGACSATTELDADYLMENNFHYSVELANYAISKGIRFIYASSAATYGDGSLGFSDDLKLIPRLRPLNMYGYSKQLFDLWVLRNNLQDQVVGLKFFNVFGPNEYHKGDMRSMVCKGYEQIRKTGKIKLFKSYRHEYGPGEQRRDFIYLKDCLKVMYWLMEHGEVNGIFNLGTGQARSWNELARDLFQAMGQPVDIEYIEMDPALQKSYQYFTQAKMKRLQATMAPCAFSSLEDAVSDYVSYLSREDDPYL